ncbi:rhodanese-like domain-containing protein [Variovorax sp. J22R133]|uniref:rhodanese-like domain-containing protein n=1 Tax=Variovorax brevis TaxID=3053503 RepID=UPI002578081A|nr:rhodanese-like domain-containing protein [Variovorax sp. J22R133]MDM0116858.1 rhodanese-like domain-containing protein [Variovorax sp. J22R133]
MLEFDEPATTATRRQGPTRAIGPETLHALLLGDDELALLDVREARAFHAGHLNLARSAPLSSLELQVGAFVPRRAVTVVLYDDAGEAGAAAMRAAALLERLGYGDVRLLQGGLRAWTEHGLPSIDGWNTLVKTFGDLVRKRYATPVLPLAELHALRESKSPLALVDVRPADEFAFLSIEGARNHPGVELALRDFSSAEKDAEPLWAINCFSRTRGILGATTLSVLGHPRAAFVEEGVMAWSLRGGAVASAARALPGLTQAPPEVLTQRAGQLRARAGIATIDGVQLERWRADPSRTLYIFDVRPEPGAASAAAADVRHVPGGQVLMHFEQLVGTRNARLVLVDDAHGLRAAVTAFWLQQFNQCEVAVLDGEAPPWSARVDEERHVDEPAVRAVGAHTLRAWLAKGDAVVVDVGPSEDFERGHIVGARYLLPASMSPLAPLVTRGRKLVFTSPDGAAARIAAQEARREWPTAVNAFWLEGGTQGWVGSGGLTTSSYTPQDLLTPFDDDWGSTMRVGPSRREAVWREYLTWERALSDRVVLDPTVRFKLLYPPIQR